ncbi:MAG TPA: adenylate/guanylate cyclase domain-containing protein, partial [Pseudonocardiaceae bacterium]|nr:adenylate/guanylate cyclase domain-containing protein [Pseudonocardiaceae bacterium]
MSDWPAADRQLPDSSQRRHLTVMFCDVVGATHISGERDVEVYFSILHAYYSECRPVVERHGGRIAQHQGDGIYVWFGYPVPKGDDAIRAVRAALDLLVVLRRLSGRLEAEIGEPLAVRIAIHAGEVLVAPVAGEVAPLAFGHTPNLAAKLQHAARPGTLVISDEVLRLVTDCFEVQTGPPAVLADGSVVPVHEVVKEKHRQGRVGRSWRTPMVDRNRERARLQGIWTAVQAGDGAAIALVGSRGIGKTRLAATVLSWAGSAEAKVLDCACNHLDTTTAYRACRTLLTQAAGIEPDDPPIVTAALLQDHLDELGMDKRVATLLATVLGLPAEAVGPAPDLTPSKLAELTTEYLVEWVRQVASTPTVLLVDDVTDADPSSLGVLARLSAAPPARLLLVLTARSDVAPPPFLAADTIEIIEVTPLPGQICEALVDAVTAKSPLEQQQRQQVLAQGEGIPLFLEELARSAQQGLHRPGLPITLTGHLQARLAAPGIDREVAGALAVADRDLDEAVLAAVLEANPQQLRARLSGLLASDLVVDTGGPGSRYRFRHGLITEAAYNLLLRDQRAHLHNRLAEALARPHTPGHPIDWNVVGKHLKLAGRPLDAFEAILTGANEASRTGAFQEALQSYRDALGIIADVKDAGTRDALEMRCRLLKGGAASVASGYTSEEAVKDFDRCAALCRQLGSRPEHLSAIIGPLSFYLTRGELSAVRRVAEDLRCWVDTGNTYHHAESAAIFGALSFFEGDYQKSGELFDSAVAEFSSRPPSDPTERNWFLPHDVAVAALAHHAVFRWFAGQHGVARKAGERAIARASTFGFPLGPFSMAYAKSYLGWANAIVGNYRTAAAFAYDVREIGQRHGFSIWESNGDAHLAIAQNRIGGRGDAADTVEHHAGAWERIGVRVFLPYFLTAAADIRAATGQHAEALAGFAAAGRAAEKTGVYF